MPEAKLVAKRKQANLGEGAGGVGKGKESPHTCRAHSGGHKGGPNHPPTLGRGGESTGLSGGTQSDLSWDFPAERLVANLLPDTLPFLTMFKHTGAFLFPVYAFLCGRRCPPNCTEQEYGSEEENKTQGRPSEGIGSNLGYPSSETLLGAKDRAATMGKGRS